jgi:hypothetical protein
LLDQDAYADVRSIREAMEQRHAPFYLRRTKEAMVFFPERQADGTWIARKVSVGLGKPGGDALGVVLVPRAVCACEAPAP